MKLNQVFVCAGDEMLKFDAETTRLLDFAYQGSDVTRRRQLSFNALDPNPGEAILDIGCGNGMLTAELARAVGVNGQVIGVDPSEDMRTAAVNRCHEFDWVTFKEGSAYALPLDDGAVDKAVSIQVFEYLDDIPTATSEMYRVLKPGGRAVVSDIHLDSLVWYSQDQARMDRMIAAWNEHFVERGVPAIIAPVMRHAGFEVEAIQSITICDAVLKPDGLALMLLRLIEGFAIQNGLVPEADAREWRAEQEDLAKQGRFFFSISQYAVSAQK